MQTASTASLAETLLSSLFRKDGVHSAAQHLLNADSIRLRAPETVLLYIGNQVIAQMDGSYCTKHMLGSWSLLMRVQHEYGLLFESLIWQ